MKVKDFEHRISKFGKYNDSSVSIEQKTELIIIYLYVLFNIHIH